MQLPWFSSLSALALLVLTGCGNGDTGHVSGTLVRHDGTPLGGARVVARSVDTGKTVTGSTDASGQFKLQTTEGHGIPAGSYEIGVQEDRGEPDARRAPTIAAKYRDPTTSAIRVNVEPGQTQELNLTLDPPQTSL